MDKLQEARIKLWKAMSDTMIPNGVLSDIGENADKAVFERFSALYRDKELSVLLLVNNRTAEAYSALWEELHPGQPLDSDVLDFLLSDDYAIIRVYWQDELTNFIRNVAKEEKRPYLISLADALYSGMQKKLDIHQVFADMLKRQISAIPDYDIVWGFCLVVLRFDLMTEELLPTFYLALEKHEDTLKKLLG